MPTSNFTRQQRQQRQQQRDAEREDRVIMRQARCAVSGLQKLEYRHELHVIASKVRASFERHNILAAPAWRPLAERLPAWLMNSSFVCVLLLLATLECYFIVAEAVSLQGESFQRWTSWLWVMAVAAMLYASLLYAKLHPMHEAADAHEAAETERENRRTRNALRIAWLATIGYAATVLFVSGLSWHYEQVAKAEREQTRQEIHSVRELTAARNPISLSEPVSKSAEPTATTLAPVAEAPEEFSWSHAWNWIAGYLFGGIRPWILAGHFLLLFWPVNLAAMAAPATYDQALLREYKCSRAKTRTANAVRPLIFAAHEAHEAGDSRLYNAIRGSLKPSTLAILDELWNEPAPPVASTTPPPAPEGPAAPPAPEPPPAPQNGPQPGTWAATGPQPEPSIDPFEGLA